MAYMVSKVQRRERARTTRVTEMAEFSGVSEQAFRKWMKLAGFPIGSDGSVCLWDLAVWRTRIDNEGELPIGDDLMDGAASPALEAFRWARAGQEQIKLEAMRQNFIPLDDVQTILVEFAAIYKNSHERMIREFGNKAGELIDETLAEAERRYQQRWGDNSPESSQTGAAS